MKKIPTTSLLGQRGVNLIERVVLEMGFLWTPNQPIEAGIDGIIEIRDPQTGQAFNNIIQVQSKALSELANENYSGFEYHCREKDLDYWLRGNAPVILIVSRPDTNEAYWISVKDYFAEPSRRKSRKIRFQKSSNRFSKDSRDALVHLSVPADSGVYLSPTLKSELLYSNLVEVVHFGPSIYIGDTPFRHRWQVTDLAKSRGVVLGHEWDLWDKKIVSFHDLNSEKWDYACDPGTVESFDASEWLFSESLDLRNLAFSLLNRALRRFLRTRGLEFDDRKECFFFRAKANLHSYSYKYKSLLQSATRTVFQPYPKDLPPDKQPSHYRHAACGMRFLTASDKLFLEVTPTWYYTFDGVHRYRYFEDRLSGMKRLEKNAAILGQVIMWSELLSSEPELFEPQYTFLKFGRLQTFVSDRGIRDGQWLPREPDGGAELRDEIGKEQTVLIDES